MDETEPIAELVQRLRGGDPLAAESLFARYAQRLTSLAEQHLSRKLASRVQGEDVVQSVFRTFFRRTAQGEFRIDSSAHIWRLLVKITLLKVRAEGRRHTAGRRDVGAEAAGGDAWLLRVVAHEPDPAEAVALVDQVEALLRGLPELFWRVLEMRLQGLTVTDIGLQLGISRRSVHRALHLLKQRLADGALDSNG
jgi:RNA polymerase sigma-70 factor (ECF subfamily)